MDINTILLIITALIAFAALIFAFLTWRTGRSNLKINREVFSKDAAKGRLMMLKNDLQDIANKPQDYEGRFREKQFGVWLTSPLCRELTYIGFMLEHMGWVVPVRLYDMVMEKGFFENKTKIQKVIREIEKLISELG